MTSCQSNVDKAYQLLTVHLIGQGTVNRKKGSDATVDMSEIKNGDPVATFIIQVAALSWAATQVPEISVAIQSLLKAGFLSAVQLELLFMIGSLQPVTKAARFQSFRNFVPKHAFPRYCR
jgi:hypothetical protein